MDSIFLTILIGFVGFVISMGILFGVIKAVAYVCNRFSRCVVDIIKDSNVEWFDELENIWGWVKKVLSYAYTIIMTILGSVLIVSLFWSIGNALIDLIDYLKGVF